MNKPIDYSDLRLKNITQPQYRHLLLLLGWVFYFIMYALTERLIPADRCTAVHCFWDDLIPFCEFFVIICICFCPIICLYCNFTYVFLFTKIKFFILFNNVL